MMKKCAFILFLTVTVAAIFCGCKKTDVVSAGMVMTADINNIPWRPQSTRVFIDKSKAMQLVVTGDSSASQIRLEIGKYTGPGIYNFSISTNAAAYLVNGNVHPASTGEIIITDNIVLSNSETEIKGTFSFLTNNAFVKNGLFDVKLYLD
ncbi:MAG: hypothetical protein H7257_07420 [Taibaiella sp.]|nr:hypothetical protein [Taibaiella sp.]